MARLHRGIPRGRGIPRDGCELPAGRHRAWSAGMSGPSAERARSRRRAASGSLKAAVKRGGAARGGARAAPQRSPDL